MAMASAMCIVGAPKADGPGSNSGEAYVVFGKAGAYQSIIELSALATAEGFKINGVEGGDMLANQWRRATSMATARAT